MRSVPGREHLVESMPADVGLHHPQDPGTELVRNVREQLADVGVARALQQMLAVSECRLDEPLSTVEQLVEGAIAVAMSKETVRQVVGEAFAHPELAAVPDAQVVAEPVMRGLV